MNQQEAVARLKAIWESGMNDPERQHSLEDDLLMEIIESMGWSDFVTEYDQIEATRWYA